MTVKLLTEHRLEFLSLKGNYTGSSESTPADITRKRVWQYIEKEKRKSLHMSKCHIVGNHMPSLNSINRHVSIMFGFLMMDIMVLLDVFSCTEGM